MFMARKKHQDKKWEEKLQQGISILPAEAQKQTIEHEIKQNREELRTTKASLWKLRTKENKLKETETVNEIKKLENKVEHVTRLLEKEKKRLLTREQQIRTTVKNTTNKNKKQDILAEVWATMRWITEYLEETTKEWEHEKLIREQDEKTIIESWDKLTRAEKIETLKQNMVEQTNQQEHRNNTTLKTTMENNVREQETQKTNIKQRKNNKEKLEYKNNNIQIARSIVQEVLNKTESTAIKKLEHQAKKTEINKLLEEIIEEITNTTNNNENQTTPRKTPILKQSKLENITPMRQQSIENFIKKQQNTPSTPRNNNTEYKNTKEKTTTKPNRNSPKITPKAKMRTRKQLRKEEEQKSVQQLRGFWTNFARKQKEHREQQKQQDENKKKLSENTSVEKSSSKNCQTDAGIEDHDSFPATSQIMKVANILENSTKSKSVINSSESKFKSENSITGSDQIKQELGDY